MPAVCENRAILFRVPFNFPGIYRVVEDFSDADRFPHGGFAGQNLQLIEPCCNGSCTIAGQIHFKHHPDCFRFFRNDLQSFHLWFRLYFTIAIGGIGPD